EAISTATAGASNCFCFPPNLTLSQQPEPMVIIQATGTARNPNAARSTCAAMLGYFVARRANEQETAPWFLDNACLDSGNGWQHALVQFLRREFAEERLLALADDEVKRTEAHCYIGLHEILIGHKEKAMEHFGRVKELGKASTIEYAIALGE